MKKKKKTGRRRRGRYAYDTTSDKEKVFGQKEKKAVQKSVRNAVDVNPISKIHS